MKRQDKSGFKSAWKNAFDEAEMMPSGQLWDKIELGLAKNANSGYKRRLMFFKLMAAASVLFAAVVGGITIYNNSFKYQDTVISEQSAPSDNLYPEHSEQNTTGQRSPVISEQKEENEAELAIKNDAKQNDNDARQQPISSKKKTDDPDTKTLNVAPDNDQLAIVSKGVEDEGNELHSQEKQVPVQPGTIPGSANSILVILAPQKLNGLGVDTYAMGELLQGEMHLVPRYAELYQQAKSNKPLWVGVDLAMGQNSPSAGAADAGMLMAEFDTQTNGLQADRMSVSEEQTGSVLSAGIAVGRQVANRWIIESGVSFIKRSTLAESNLAVAGSGTAQALNSLSNAEQSDQVFVTDSYELQNTYNSIAIPIQAGYLLLDSRFDIALKAGLSNEILLWNRIEDTSGDLESVTINSGSGSQYNTYLLSGLVGSEFSYLITDRYHVSLTPQVRKSINSVTKTNGGEGDRPIIFTIGFKLNYLFK